MTWEQSLGWMMTTGPIVVAAFGIGFVAGAWWVARP